jgi:23S rRNA maturation mini-RNase III
MYSDPRAIHDHTYNSSTHFHDVIGVLYTYHVHHSD